MPAEFRSKNLDLIRWLNTTHKKTAEKLRTVVTNPNYLSQMARGEMVIQERKARQIEKVLGLPANWMDRDNLKLLQLSSTDYELYVLLCGCPEDAKDGLIKFLSSMSQ